MAERRMFAKTIIDSDAFLEMPLSTQALYFHLAMRADDEGFINNPKKIQRMINASEDDLKVLVAKKFIIPFESGVVVIKHWKIHNYIRKDRIAETNYTEERSQLVVKENGAYTINADVSQLAAKCQADGGIGKVSIGKDSIDKDNIYTYGSNFDSCDASNFDLFWMHYPRKVGKAAAKKAFTFLNEKTQKIFEAGISKMQGHLDAVNFAVTENGTRGQKLELISNRLMSQKTNFETLRSENEDIDITEVAIKLSSAELTYSSALMATGKVLQNSLMNFI